MTKPKAKYIPSTANQFLNLLIETIIPFCDNHKDLPQLITRKTLDDMNGARYHYLSIYLENKFEKNSIKPFIE